MLNTRSIIINISINIIISNIIIHVTEARQRDDDDS